MNKAHLSYHSPKIEIRKSGTQGIGLFATHSIEKDELILVTCGRYMTLKEANQSEDSGIPFQIEKNVFVAPFDFQRPEGIFAVNHSCLPNAGIRGQLSLVALRAIQVGEEICYDYVMTDSAPENTPTMELHCLCKTAQCRGVITDLDWKREDLRTKHAGYFSSYLQHRIRHEISS